VSDLKEMCSVLKKEKVEVEKRLSHIRGVGRSMSELLKHWSSHLSYSYLLLLPYSLAAVGKPYLSWRRLSHWWRR